MEPTLQEIPPDCRTRLMEAALLLIADKGYDGTGIREIAQKAQANSAMVQYHFGGKEGLYVTAMGWVNGLLAAARGAFPPLPSRDDPQFRVLALEALKGHIALLLEEFLTCHGRAKCANLSPEVWQAAHRLWNREMESPRPATVDLIVGVIRPFTDHLRGCIQLLRPELSEEDAFLMSVSVHSQLFFIHKHQDLIQLLKGRAYGPEDLDRLTAHFTGFTLRGLGLPEATALLGA